MNNPVNFAPVVMFIEANWYEFVEYAGGEDAAELILNVLKADCSMD